MFNDPTERHVLANRVVLVCRLLVVRPVVCAMKHRTLIVTGEENVWWVRLDGVEVVSFCGPHAQEWAYREREELAQLLNAQTDTEPDVREHESVSHALLSQTQGTKVQTL
jgi:hypothetical protein